MGIALGSLTRKRGKSDQGSVSHVSDGESQTTEAETVITVLRNDQEGVYEVTVSNVPLVDDDWEIIKGVESQSVSFRIDYDDSQIPTSSSASITLPAMIVQVFVKVTSFIRSQVYNSPMIVQVFVKVT
jgi:hypothetical protein